MSIPHHVAIIFSVWPLAIRETSTQALHRVIWIEVPA
jgi:hypothetical protein